MSTIAGAASFSLLALVLSYPSFANTWTFPAHTWGGVSADSVDSIALDSSGNLYAAGYTDSFGAGQHDVLIVKYDPLGNFVWAKTWGGVGVDFATSVKVGPDGLLYVTGVTSSFGVGDYDLFLLQLDTGGNLNWGTTWGGSAFDAGYDIAFDATGNVYVVGESYSVSPCCAAVLLKFSPEGMLLQPAIFYKGPATYDTGISLAVDSQFNVIVAGISRDYSVSPRHSSILLLKYAPNGMLVWQENWSTPSYGQDEADGVHGIITDSEDNIYVGGRHSAQCDNNNFLQCDFDSLLLKLDTNGMFDWAKTWGSTGTYDSAQNVAIDTNNHIAVAGVENEFAAAGGSPLLFVLTYDNSGNPLSQTGWSQGTWQSNNQDSPTGMILDSSNNVYIASAALNNSGIWSPTTANSGSLTNSLITNSYVTSTYAEPTMTLTNPTALQTAGVRDTGGGAADAFVSQYQYGVGFLTFPLHGMSPGENQNLTPQTAQINTVFDHMMLNASGDFSVYGCDKNVEDFVGEVGNTKASKFHVDCRHGYQNATKGFEFLQGVANYSPDDATNLYYDGHPGYDFQSDYGNQVYAAISGTVSYPTLSSLNSEGIWAGGNPDIFNIMELDPGNGYKVFYLHLSTHTRNIATGPLTASLTGQNFIATQTGKTGKLKAGTLPAQSPLFISGQVTLNGQPLPGVQVNLNGNIAVGTKGSCTAYMNTDSNGNYMFVGLESGYKYNLYISPTKGYTFAAQNPSALVPDGAPVRAGDLIALSGDAGPCTASHLHFEVQQKTSTAVTMYPANSKQAMSVNYVPVDPYGWCPSDQSVRDPYLLIPGLLGAGVTNLYLWSTGDCRQ